MTEIFEGLDVSVWITIKAFLVFALFLYLIFAFVIIKQVNHMTNTLEVGFETAIRILAWLHFLFAIITLIVALVVL
jgi:hypothetical protein